MCRNTVILTFLFLYCVLNQQKTRYIIVGVVLRAANQNLLIAGGNHTIIPSATCRPPREMFNLWGQMVPPETWYPHCSGGNLPPTGPEGRNRGTFTFVTAKPETSVIQALSVSGVEESTTLENEPPQDKNCHLGRFLDSARNDMSGRGGGTIQSNGLYLPRCQPLAGAGWRWVNAATLFRILGGTIQPHRLNTPRGGRQVAAPT